MELPVEQASNSKSLWEDVNQTVIPNVDLVDGKCEGKRSLPPESGSEVVYSSDAKSAAVSYKALKDLVTSLVNKLPLDSASAEPSVEVLDVDRLFAYFTDPSHPSPSNGNKPFYIPGVSLLYLFLPLTLSVLPPSSPM